MGSSQITREEQREQRLKLLEDDIGRHLAQAQARGELQSARGYGQPLDFGDGYDETPVEWRLPMKMLKDAGIVPPEVEAMQQIAALQAEADRCTDASQAPVLQRRLAEMRQALALRLEALRRG